MVILLLYSLMYHWLLPLQDSIPVITYLTAIMSVTTSKSMKAVAGSHDSILGGRVCKPQKLKDNIIFGRFLAEALQRYERIALDPGKMSSRHIVHDRVAGMGKELAKIVNALAEAAVQKEEEDPVEKSTILAKGLARR